MGMCKIKAVSKGAEIAVLSMKGILKILNLILQGLEGLQRVC